MAAGIGSRFGGSKQLAAVGPDGEAFLDFAISDAAAAGIDRIVLVIRSDIESDVRRHVEVRHSHRDVSYVRQDEHGPPRAKPWGTGHAVLTAAVAVDGPFVVCNADDYYGSTSYSAIARAADTSAEDEAVLAGFRLAATLPGSGSVSRGICSVRDGRLVAVTEHHGIERNEMGVITAREPRAELSDDTIASMNLWAFPAAFFARLERDFEQFLGAVGSDPTAEFQLPTVVSDMMADRELSVGVVPTAETWVGVTNPTDLEIARDLIAAMRTDDEDLT